MKTVVVGCCAKQAAGQEGRSADRVQMDKAQVPVGVAAEVGPVAYGVPERNSQEKTYLHIQLRHSDKTADANSDPRHGSRHESFVEVPRRFLAGNHTLRHIHYARPCPSSPTRSQVRGDDRSRCWAQSMEALRDGQDEDNPHPREDQLQDQDLDRRLGLDWDRVEVLRDDQDEDNLLQHPALRRGLL